MSSEYPVVVTEEFLIALDCFDWSMFNLDELVECCAVLASPAWYSFRKARRSLERTLGIRLCATVDA